MALCVVEPASARVDPWLKRQANEIIVTSPSALTETTSALGIKVRRKDVTKETAGKALELLEREILPLLAILDAPVALFTRAEILLRSFDPGLRAGDALHLACCLDSDELTLATADATLYTAARKLGRAAVKVY